MRNYQEDTVTRHNKRVLRVWKVVVACIVLISVFLINKHYILKDINPLCNEICRLYHSVGRAALSLIIFFVGLLVLQLCPVKTWTIVVYLSIFSLIAMVVCSFLYMPASVVNSFLLAVPILSGLWFVYQSFIVVHLAHYFHFCVVSLRFGGFLSLFPGSCTIAPNVLLQVYAGTAVLVNILLMYGVSQLRNDFKVFDDATKDHHTGILMVLDASFYLDIVLSLLSIQPQFNKGLITMNSIIAYQLLVFSQLLPFTHSPFHYTTRILSILITVVSVCYMVIDRQHSSLIIYHASQCQKNPLYFTVPDESSESCLLPRRIFARCSQLAARILRMAPTQIAEETYELVSHLSDSDRSGNNNNHNSGSLGWSTIQNLYSSPNTSMETNEQEEDLEEGEVDPDCMGDDLPETSLLRSSSGGGGGANASAAAAAVSNRMDRSSSQSDSLLGPNILNSSSLGVVGPSSGAAAGGLLSVSSSGKSKLSIANIPMNEANYNSINSPNGSGSGNRNFDIENNYQESTSGGVSGCCYFCSACCLMPASKNTGSSSRSTSYFTALTNVLLEKSVMFNLTMICLVCYCTMLITNWAAPDGKPLNIFREPNADYDQSVVVYGIMVVSVVALWLFYSLSLYGSYRLYYQYKRIRARLYRSRLVQHHPVRTSVIL